METDSFAPLSRSFYLKNPIVRALAQSIPWGGALDAAFSTYLETIIEKRRRIFFEKLDRGRIRLSEDVIRAEEFLHCFHITLRAVDRTRREEKIRLFARLLGAATHDGTVSNTDDYEDLLRIVDELSVQEWRLLMALEKYESLYYQDGRFSEEHRPHEGRFQEIAAEYLLSPTDQLSDNELLGLVIRLNRTGCYALMGWRKGPAIDCRLTSIYHRLKALLESFGSDVDLEP